MNGLEPGSRPLSLVSEVQVAAGGLCRAVRRAVWGELSQALR
jgi:hypothetical protein